MTAVGTIAPTVIGLGHGFVVRKMRSQEEAQFRLAQLCGAGIEAHSIITSRGAHFVVVAPRLPALLTRIPLLQLVRA